MKGKTILGLVGVGLVAVAIFAANQARTAISNIQYSISSFGIPRIGHQQVFLPVIVRFVNPALVPVPVQTMNVALSIYRNNQWVPAGHVDQQNFSINPGTSEVPVNATLDLKVITGNVLSTLNSLLGGTLQIKADVSITVAGQTTQQSLTKPIRL